MLIYKGAFIFPKYKQYLICTPNKLNFFPMLDSGLLMSGKCVQHETKSGHSSKESLFLDTTHPNCHNECNC